MGERTDDHPRGRPSVADWALFLAASLPLLYFPVFMAVLLSLDTEVPAWFLASTLGAILLSWVVIGVVVVDAARRKELDEPNRLTWILGLLLVGAFVAPVYVWKYRLRR